MVASARNSSNRTRTSANLSTAGRGSHALASGSLHLPRLECARHVRGRIKGDQLPGIGSRQESARQGIVQPVAGFVGGIFADQGMSEQVQVADRIEHLVLGEFVIVT